jgi:hypothetical protein
LPDVPFSKTDCAGFDSEWTEPVELEKMEGPQSALQRQHPEKVPKLAEPFGRNLLEAEEVVLTPKCVTDNKKQER